MENFFIDDSFYKELWDYLAEQNLDDEDDILLLEDDFSIEVQMGKREQVFTVTDDLYADIADRLIERHIERIPEENNVTAEDILEAVRKSVYIGKMNEALPWVWFPSGQKAKITKQDLLEYIK